MIVIRCALFAAILAAAAAAWQENVRPKVFAQLACNAGDSHVTLISAVQSEAVCSAFCNVTPGLAMRCLTYWMKL
ncbi:unnamed protein product [Danaus chrysippus]|uniref:(African queen) hypothetical protein n=1 Tax=Danaus chrysippus TaxID=151541 RepID=A0A8J2QJ86_9NEOP|nr:unnamed protein product [Danaus chrysippus]